LQGNGGTIMRTYLAVVAIIVSLLCVYIALVPLVA
jgi:hypothetical protein